MDLYVVRHAVAHKRDADRWPDDARRPLTPEGEEEFRAVARGLGRLVPKVDALLSSPFERAWRTAGILTEAAGWSEPKAFPPLEADVPPHEAVAALASYAETGSLAIVGHRPGLHELVSYLLIGDTAGASIQIEKGGALHLRFDEPMRPGTGELRWLFTPKALREIGPE